MFEKIKKNIKGLPPLPQNVSEINRVCDDKNSSINDLAKIIEKDPMLTTNLFKIANSPLYGFRREVKNILNAISLFGMSTTRSLVLEISINTLLKSDLTAYNISTEDLALVSRVQSILVKNWYRKIDKKKMEILFLTALLQEIGKVFLSNEISKTNNFEDFRKEIETTNDIATIEREFVGITTSEVTSEVFSHWNFDKKIIDIIKHSDSYNKSEIGEIREYAFAVKVVKTAVPVNFPLDNNSIDKAVILLEEEGMDEQLFLDAISETVENL